MVERQKNAPPAVQSTGVDQTAVASDVKSLTPALFAEYWPPAGWPMFACVTRPSGTVRAPERNATGGYAILKYEVQRDPSGVYTIDILKGDLGHSGEVALSSALSIRFSGCEDWSNERAADAVLDVFVNGKQLIPERGLVLRLILAMTFIISRIDRGLKPNLAKTLKIYRLE